MSASVLPIYTYGGGALLNTFFNALGSQHGHTSPYVQLIHLATLLGGTWALVDAISKRQLMLYFRWFCTATLMLYLVFYPTVSVRIVDRTLGGAAQQKVDHVPLGLGVIASLTSHIGDRLTQLVEPLFSAPDDLRYHRSGLLMASRLMQASREFSLQDDVLKESLSHFMQQCVFYDIALKRYTLSDLKRAPDLWGFLKSHASHARAFTLEQKDGPSTLTPCYQGVNVLEGQWQSALGQTANYYGQQWFPRRIDAQKMLLRFLPLGLQPLQNASVSGATVLKQLLVYHSLETGLLNLSTTHNMDAAMSQYAFVKAQQHKRMTNTTMGQMAAHWLPLMKNVFEAMLYGAFFLVFLLCLFPFGTSILKNYIFSLMWLQSWAPLYAIINGVISFYLAERTTAFVGQTDISSITGLQQLHSDMVGLAGYLTMSVPFIAMGLVRSLASTFTQMAAYIGGVTQSAASSAAGEAVSGNISTGNFQADNTSMHNHSANHWDSFAVANSGGFKFNLPGGSHASLSPVGNPTLDSRAAISQLGFNLHQSDSVRTSAIAAAEHAESAAKSNADHFSESFSASARNAFELATHHAKSASSGDNYSITDNAQVSDSLNYMNTMAEKFAHDHHLSISDATKQLWGAYANLNLHTGLQLREPKVVKWLSVLGWNIGADVSGGVKYDGGYETNKQHTHLYQAAEDFSKQHQLSQHIDTVIRAGHDRQFHTQNDEGHRLVDNLNQSTDKMWQSRQDVQAQYHLSHQYRDLSQISHDKASTFDTQANQSVVNYLLTQPSLTNPNQTMSLEEIETLNVNAPLKLKPYIEQFQEAFNETTMKNWIKTHKPDLATEYQHLSESVPGDAAIKAQATQAHEQVSITANQVGIVPGQMVDTSIKHEVEEKIQQNKASIKESAIKAIQSPDQQLQQQVKQHLPEKVHKKDEQKH